MATRPRPACGSPASSRRKRPGPGRPARPDRCRISDGVQRFQHPGPTLDWVSGYFDGSQDRYAAIWRKIPNVPAWQARHGSTADQYQTFFNDMNGQGYKPVTVCGYSDGHAARYAAIFRKIAGAPGLASPARTYGRAIPADLQSAGRPGLSVGIGQRLHGRRPGPLRRDLDEVMGETTMPEVKWFDKPQDHDFPAAGDYLALIADPQVVTALTDKLRAGGIVHKKAKDILRASRLPLLPVDNPHVASDLAKIKKAKQLSPILLVRGDFGPTSRCNSRHTTGYARAITPTRTPTSQSCSRCPTDHEHSFQKANITTRIKETTS